MKMKFFHGIPVTVAAILFSHSAFADGVTVKTGYDYSSGKYGTDTTTAITSIPFIASYEKDDWIFKAVMPYVRINGASNVISGLGAVSGANSSVRTASGWGDVTLSATKGLWFDAKAKMGLDVTGKIKLGTAVSTKGLGTGENDYWVLADAYKQIGSITYLGGVGYGVLGDSPLLQLKNVVSANIGASYRINETASIGAIFDTRTKSSDTGSAQRELTAFYMLKLGGGYKLQAYALKGFADGSPDWGAGANVAYNF
jgi:hypothetical protein